MNRKRSLPKWQKDDSDPEDDSHDFDEEEEAEIKELKDSLKQLFAECVKLNMQLQQTQQMLTQLAAIKQ